MNRIEKLTRILLVLCLISMSINYGVSWILLINLVFSTLLFLLPYKLSTTITTIYCLIITAVRYKYLTSFFQTPTFDMLHLTTLIAASLIVLSFCVILLNRKPNYKKQIQEIAEKIRNFKIPDGEKLEQIIKSKQYRSLAKKISKLPKEKLNQDILIYYDKGKPNQKIFITSSDEEDTLIEKINQDIFIYYDKGKPNQKIFVTSSDENETTTLNDEIIFLLYRIILKDKDKSTKDNIEKLKDAINKIRKELEEMIKKELGEVIKKDSRNPKQLIKFARKIKNSNLYERALLSIDLMEERALLNKTQEAKSPEEKDTSPEDSKQKHSNQSGNSL